MKDLCRPLIFGSLLILFLSGNCLAQHHWQTPVEDVYSDDWTDDQMMHFAVDASHGTLTPAEKTYLQSGMPYSPALATLQHAGVRKEFLYVLDLLSNSVCALAIDNKTGAASFIAKYPSTGSAPSSIAIDPRGRFLFVTNSGSNTVAAFSIDPATGALAPVPGSPFPTGMLPATVVTTPSGRRLYIANQFADSITSYSVGRHSGILRHRRDFTLPDQNPGPLLMAPDGRHLFVTALGSGNLWVLAIGKKGSLQPVAGSPFPAGTTPLRMVMHPSGRFLYVIDVTTRSVSLFDANPRTGALGAGLLEVSGSRPNAMAIDPTGRFFYLVNMDNSGGTPAGNISVYDINPASGTLTFINMTSFTGNPDSLVIGCREGCSRFSFDNAGDRDDDDDD